MPVKLKRRFLLSHTQYSIMGYHSYIQAKHITKKARLNGCNMLGHHPTLLATTCCLRLNTTLGHVVQCWKMLDEV